MLLEDGAWLAEVSSWGHNLEGYFLASNPFFCLWLVLCSLLSVHHEVSRFPLPCPSSMVFLPWNQLTTDCKLWNCKPEQDSNSLNCGGQMFCSSKKRGLMKSRLDTTEVAGLSWLWASSYHRAHGFHRAFTYSTFPSDSRFLEGRDLLCLMSSSFNFRSFVVYQRAKQYRERN